MGLNSFRLRKGLGGFFNGQILIMSKANFPASLAMVLLMLFSAGPAFAQSGSVGGTVGKTNKSISGEQPPPASQTLPANIQFTEHGAAGVYSATLRHLGGNEYEATWNVAVTSRMTVRMTKDSMTIQRQDSSNLAGLASGIYSGIRTGKTASGTFSIGVNHGTWNALW